MIPTRFFSKISVYLESTEASLLSCQLPVGAGYSMCYQNNPSAVLTHSADSVTSSCMEADANANIVIVNYACCKAPLLRPGGKVLKYHGTSLDTLIE